VGEGVKCLTFVEVAANNSPCGMEAHHHATVVFVSLSAACFFSKAAICDVLKQDDIQWCVRTCSL